MKNTEPEWLLQARELLCDDTITEDIAPHIYDRVSKRLKENENRSYYLSELLGKIPDPVADYKLAEKLRDSLKALWQDRRATITEYVVAKNVYEKQPSIRNMMTLLEVDGHLWFNSLIIGRNNNPMSKFSLEKMLEVKHKSDARLQDMADMTMGKVSHEDLYSRLVSVALYPYGALEEIWPPHSFSEGRSSMIKYLIPEEEIMRERSGKKVE